MPENALYIGHSLVGRMMPDMLNTFAEQAGISFQAEAQIINGAPLLWNWENGATAEGANARALLPTGNYDVLILTEATPLADQVRWNDTYGYAQRYFELAIAANPNTQTFIYETWPALDGDIPGWAEQIATDLDTWESIADHLNAIKPADAPDALVIPAAQALSNLRDAINLGRVPGLSSIEDVFSDDIHLNATGNWFIAALQAEVVAGLDASSVPLQTYDFWDVPYPAPLASTANAMREIIDETLTYYPNDGVDPSGSSPSPGGPGAAPIEIDGTEGADVLIGDEATNIIQGFAGDDILVGGMGNDTLDGGDGLDQAEYSGSLSAYTLTLQNYAFEIEDRRQDGDGTDQLINVETLQFSAGETLDLSAIGGGINLTEAQLETLIELYIAYFNRAPDAVGLNFWATSHANGLGIDQIARLFNDQEETRATYPDDMTISEVVTAVYDNVLGRSADTDGFTFWRDTLDSGAVTRDQFILAILDGAKAAPPDGSSAEFIAQQTADRAYLAEKTDVGAYFAVHLGLSNVSDATTTMAHFDGSALGTSRAVEAADEFYQDILSGAADGLLMPLVGVLSDSDFV